MFESTRVFLKRIVLNGFKSFADRTEFDFGPGRTAIVGPNGCGKSNVLDAVRWVLGEQSAKTLRGTKMQDVIFAGSRTRKPANFAEVNLTFDNSRLFLACDDKEVVVSRFLYRNGDSEYRLNGKRCRMKDIRDLFLDTGVGVDAYSVIEQGRVDALLQANPLERREIFEEAAGISRYRARRVEAQRKLERTQNNLLRLSDVVEELEKRLRSVKIAAGKARNFKEYDARLRELKSIFALAEHYELDRSLAEQEGRRRERSDELAELRSSLARRDADGAELEHAAQELDEHIQGAEERLRALETEHGALLERLAQGERRMVELDAARARSETQALEAERQSVELAARAQEEQQAVDGLMRAEQEAAERIGVLEQRREEITLDFRATRSGLESERSAAFDAAREASRLHNEAENLEQRRQRVEGRLAMVEERRREADARQAELEARRGQLAEEAEQFERESAELSRQAREQERALAELEARINNLEAELVELKEQRGGVQSRLDLLEDLERRFEGIEEGARWLLNWKTDAGQRAGTVVGLVADILHIDDERVALLEPVLSRFEHQVVVRDGYAFLAEMNRRGQPPGPAEVLALDRLVARQMPVDYSAAPGFVARVADWVRCAPEFQALAEYLLGRVILVDVLERALALAQSAPDGYCFVTEKGESVADGGRITVGGAKSRAGLISRKTQIRGLRVALDELETRLERTRREQAAFEEQLSDAKLRRESLLESIAAVQKRHADARTAQVRLQDEAERVEREAALLRSECAELQRVLTETIAQWRQADAQRAAAEAARHEHEERIRSFERVLIDRETAVHEMTSELTAAQIEAGRATERRGARQQALQELRRRAEALDAEATRARRETIEFGCKIEEAREEQRLSAARRVELGTLCEQQRAEAAGLREQRQALRQRVEACGAAARELHAAIEKAEEALRDCEVRVRETEVRRESLIARVREELSLDLTALAATYEHVERDWAAIQAEIEELRGKILRLGNVNLDALDELEELSPRYDNLIAQRDDLLESIGRLENLIAELDEESRARFASCFDEVRENFLELFRKLFGGGKADIILEDPTKPLECGIEIIARPPGKEPRSISLLSGGEKTMTAVALLFAVFKRKPSPFAILDEVDAALDESNIDRFNTMLNDFLTETQFVLITHSKRTMQSADTLYGVTMQEPGVSKRVSVRFDDRVETPHVA